ncbi:MAG: DUF4870 domain-containing protein [Candidatus Eremiobacteraeota bacterium]|nr:DUF4870 domain-containing protein [Candidatus Eremiobacteraeota bacterium]
MDCYFHANVPSVAACTDCRIPICATCRDERGSCPKCRLAERIDAASGKQRLEGAVGYARTAQPEPEPVSHASTALAVPVETRALVALGYPFWPLAIVALIDPKRNGYVKRQAWQALGFNFGMYALWFGLHAIAAIPILGISAWPLLPLIVPVAFVASVVYGFKVWNGEDVRIPIVTDWVDSRLTV